jgi:hypothetical protein
MVQEPLWKRAVRRGIEHARREPRDTDFDQACMLSAYAIDCTREYLSKSDNPTEQELLRRFSVYRIEREEMERQMAATWRQVVVTK